MATLRARVYRLGVAGSWASIGFGEAASAFAQASGAAGLVAFDRLTDCPDSAASMHARMARAGVRCAPSAPAAVAGAALVLSLVTPDQTVAAAAAAAAGLRRGAIWCDMNSAAPGTKRAAAKLIEAAGARYADVAVMAPVSPAGLDVPLLVASPHRAAAMQALGTLGFTRIADAGQAVGQAAAIKLIRSVMVKGLEALSAECALAAAAEGVEAAVFGSLDASERAMPWAARISYNLERMLTHGGRRAAELAEAEAALGALGLPATMTRAARGWQAALHGGVAADGGLAARIAACRARIGDGA